MLLVSGILPRGQNNFHGYQHSNEFLQSFNSTVTVINDALRAVDSHLTWMPYVEFPMFYKNNGDIDRELLSRDGLHLSLKGTQTLATTLRHSIANALHLKEELAVSQRTYAEIPSDSTFVGPMLYRDAVVASRKSHVETVGRSVNPVRPDTSPEKRGASLSKRIVSPVKRAASRMTCPWTSVKRARTPVQETSAETDIPKPTTCSQNRFSILTIEETNPVILNEDSTGVHIHERRCRKLKKRRSTEQNIRTSQIGGGIG